MQKVTVVGSGIIGLTAAIALQESGFTVRILAKDQWESTLSRKVGAVWFPYAIEPKDKSSLWAATAYHRYKSEEGIAAGVSFIPFLNAYTDEKKEEWVNELPKGTVRKATQEELPMGMEKGFIAEVPLAEPPLYLPYLLEKFLAQGGTFEQKTISSLSELAALDGWVINCTGLGAKIICKDRDLHPMRGQILRVEKLDVPSFADPTRKGALSYIIQRSQDCVIGGTDYEDDWNEEIDPEDTTRILTRLKGFGINSDPKLLEIIVGLRPKRSAVRFEFDPDFPNVFHNYGHGGAGFTVAWGCATELAEILKKAQMRN
ncbi:FAD-dependent oxidoreductase [Algoriphagus mannitolivorans]|uniref:FAD-dependent oxidoreductase n=1 Tax=Algoriphagus mannitolivorans TaxID=226504 RepID=UPI0004014ADE|nr:FAD-dependent oxidoreductase [Algoriphagus mannitolivorans]